MIKILETKAGFLLGSKGVIKMQTVISPYFIGVAFAVLVIFISLFISWAFPKRASGGVERTATGDRGETIKQIVAILLFVVGGLPLIVYPFVLIANAMSLAGFMEGNINYVLFTCALLFVVATSTYPLTYIACLVAFFRKGNRKILTALIPLLHILVAVLFVLLIPILDKRFS